MRHALTRQIEPNVRIKSCHYQKKCQEWFDTTYLPQRSFPIYGALQNAIKVMAVRVNKLPEKVKASLT